MAYQNRHELPAPSWPIERGARTDPNG